MEQISNNPLLNVCRLLNEEGAEYLVVGAWAMILNGLIRATEDVDILIAENPSNYQKVIQALSRLPDGAASELVPEDFAENSFVKIADDIEVDVGIRAWTVTYAEAHPNAQRTRVEGVEIPYLSISDLIRSKNPPGPGSRRSRKLDSPSKMNPPLSVPSVSSVVNPCRRP
jgi:hypothetical protein